MAQNKIKEKNKVEKKQIAKNNKFYSFSFYKLIIPIVIFLALLSFHFSTVYLNNQFDNYACKTKTIFDNILSASLANSTEKINKANEDLVLLNEEINEKVYSKKFLLTFSFASNLISAKVNPFYPVDCSIAGFSKSCNHYMKEETYNCIKDIASTYENGLLIATKMPEYKKLNYSIIFINWIILVLLGYIISIIISYGKSRIKKFYN